MTLQFFLREGENKRKMEEKRFYALKEEFEE
jgi:hypothetical protein